MKREEKGGVKGGEWSERIGRRRTGKSMGTGIRGYRVKGVRALSEKRKGEERLG